VGLVKYNRLKLSMQHPVAACDDAAYIYINAVSLEFFEGRTVEPPHGDCPQICGQPILYNLDIFPFSSQVLSVGVSQQIGSKKQEDIQNLSKPFTLFPRLQAILHP
jgi:hypothetical protein